MLMAAKSENFKTLIDAELKERLTKVLDVKNLSLTDFVENVVRWFLDQDDLVQSLVAGQLAPTPAILELVRFWAKTEGEDDDVEFRFGKSGLIAEEVKRPRGRRGRRG